MLLGFKRQFAPFVQDGSKTHTIRELRKIPPKVGDMCHCYVDPRQKSMRLLGRWKCVRVQDIRIENGIASPLRVWIDGAQLSEVEVEQLFHRDGFRDTNTSGVYAATLQALGFWRDRLPFEGNLIHWRYSR